MLAGSQNYPSRKGMRPFSKGRGVAGAVMQLAALLFSRLPLSPSRLRRTSALLLKTALTSASN